MNGEGVGSMEAPSPYFYELCVKRYGAIANRIAHSFAETGEDDWRDYYQECMLWIGQRLTDIMRYESESAHPERPVWTGMRNACIVYQRSQRASRGNALPLDVTFDDGGSVSLGDLGEPLDIEPGSEAEFPEDGDLGYYFYRVFLDELQKFPDTFAMMRDVFWEGLSQEAAGEKRGLSPQSIGKHIRWATDKAAREARRRIAEHIAR